MDSLIASLKTEESSVTSLLTVLGLRLPLTTVPSPGARFLTVSLPRRWLMNLYYLQGFSEFMNLMVADR